MVKKILTIVGARPQFVKAAALSPRLAAHGSLEEIIVHTGQHFDADMSDIFFNELAIPKPRFNLGIGGGTHGQNTGRMIEALEQIMLDQKPDCVLVYGDTDSTLAGGIAASKLDVRIAHVESGLRSFKRAMPEEVNRVLTDHVSDILYTPSSASDINLEREGIPKHKIVRSGDVMLDVVRQFQGIAEKQSLILERLGLRKGQFNLLTLHRKENTDHLATLAGILEGLSVSPLPVIFPIHPRTAKRIAEFGITLPPCIRTIEPLGYLDVIKLLGACDRLMTDSGGMQKEAYFLGRPCITLREETEWVELVDAGVNILTGSSPDAIASAMRCASWTVKDGDIYGDGHAAEIIASDLVKRIL